MSPNCAVPETAFKLRLPVVRCFALQPPHLRRSGAIAVAFRFLVILLVAVAAIRAHAESFSYELYETSANGARTLLKQGARQYSVEDVIRTEHPYEKGKWVEKTISVADGFLLGVSDFRDPDLSGFGLTLKDHSSFFGRFFGGGFSWDWFDRQEGNIFKKLQGGGSVRVLSSPLATGTEIASVEVLADITLRVNSKPWFFFSRHDNYSLVLKKGSVLRFAP